MKRLRNYPTLITAILFVVLTIGISFWGAESCQPPNTVRYYIDAGSFQQYYTDNYSMDTKYINLYGYYKSLDAKTYHNEILTIPISQVEKIRDLHPDGLNKQDISPLP